MDIAHEQWCSALQCILPSLFSPVRLSGLSPPGALTRGKCTPDPTTRFSERFQVSKRVLDLTPRYALAPGQDVPVVMRNRPNSVLMRRWGCMPHWAKDDN